MLPSETMIWQPEFTDKTLSRKPGAVQDACVLIDFERSLRQRQHLPSIQYSPFVMLSSSFSFTQLKTPKKIYAT
ncbi:hypothetical protein RAG54_25680, partial [Klebsiella pneumoniae]